MVFHTKETVSSLSLDKAQQELLKYSNLCRANMAVIEILEKQVGKLVAELGARNQIVLDAQAQAQLGVLKDKIFGRSSERRIGDGGLPLFRPKEGGEKPEVETVTYEREKKKREKFGPTAQPDLPRKEVLHELSQEEMTAQGLAKWEGQCECSELITVIPTKFVIEDHRRQKYRKVSEGEPTVAQNAPVIVTAPGPLKLKEGSRYSIEFAVDVGISKYNYHLPLTRQARMAKATGLVVTSQVLYDQIDTIAWYLQSNVIPGIRAKIMASHVNLGDETYWQNLGKGAKKRFWLWGVRNEKAVLFDIYDSRSKAVAQVFLKGLSGVLLTDGYSVYRNLGLPGLILANDWAHVRRKVVAAEVTHPEDARWLLEQIRSLFAIEEKIKGQSPETRSELRKTASKPITEAIHARLCILKSTLPKSPMGRAVNYALNLWPGLTRFLSDPEIPLDTNAIERTFRSPVVGRNNHHGSKTLESARMAAIWYTIIATCEANGVDPRGYIDDTLRRILTQKSVVMPWDWKPPSSPPSPGQSQ